MLDLLITDGTVIDGSGGSSHRAHVGVSGDRIAYVGLDPLPALRTIEAQGLLVMPGFIDAHTHSEFTLLADGRAEARLLQGVTTEINGNCGLSAAPLLGEAREHRELALQELDIRERWSTFEEYFSLLRMRGVGVNYGTLCGHGSLRASVVGYGDRPASGEEMAQMKQLFRGALLSGAKGLSTGLIYPPGVYATTGEIIELARVASAELDDGIYSSHMRSEGDELLEAIREALVIGRDGGLRTHISHVKTSGQRNWSKAEGAIALMAHASGTGQGLTADRYPYTASSTDLDSILPAWVYDGGTDAEIERLQDPPTRRRIAREIGEQDDGYWDSVMISVVFRPENKWMESETLRSAAENVGKRPVEFLFDLLVVERARVGAIFFSMNEDNLRRFLRLPYVMVGSDSSARCFSGPTVMGKPHPRGFGSFPRFLSRYVRDEGLLDLTEAVRKITALPAATFNLHGRGLLRDGYYADITIADYIMLADRATFKKPYQKPEGIIHVLVNGVTAVRDGELTGLRSGKVV